MFLQGFEPTLLCNIYMCVCVYVKKIVGFIPVSLKDLNQHCCVIYIYACVCEKDSGDSSLCPWKHQDPHSCVIFDMMEFINKYNIKVLHSRTNV